MSLKGVSIMIDLESLETIFQTVSSILGDRQFTVCSHTSANIQGFTSVSFYPAVIYVTREDYDPQLEEVVNLKVVQIDEQVPETEVNYLGVQEALILKEQQETY